MWRHVRRWLSDPLGRRARRLRELLARRRELSDDWFFGWPEGWLMYVHESCAGRFLRRMARRGRVPNPPGTRHWLPRELIGRYLDITQCDECRRFFIETDQGYMSYQMVLERELREAIHSS